MQGACCSIGDAFPQVGKSGGAWITQALLLGMGSLTAALPIISASFVAVVGGWIAAVASMGRQMEVRSLNVSSCACGVQALRGPGQGEVCLLLASGGAQGLGCGGVSSPRAHPACLHGVSLRPVLAHTSCWTPGAQESGLCSAALTPRCTGPSGLPAGSPG